MSHKCTGNRRRKQLSSQRSSCPSCSSRKGLPEKITAARIKRVLEHWTVKGICMDNAGGYSHIYWGFVKGRSGKDHPMRVVVSPDDQTLLTSYYDGGAAGALRKLAAGNTDWFEQRCLEWEVRK